MSVPLFDPTAHMTLMNDFRSQEKMMEKIAPKSDGGIKGLFKALKIKVSCGFNIQKIAEVVVEKINNNEFDVKTLRWFDKELDQIKTTLIEGKTKVPEKKVLSF